LQPFHLFVTRAETANSWWDVLVLVLRQMLEAEPVAVRRAG